MLKIAQFQFFQKESITQRSRMNRIETTTKSIDLEEDPEPPVPTPEPITNTVKEEVKETIKDDKTDKREDKKEEEAKPKPKIKAWSGSEAGLKFWAHNNSELPTERWVELILKFLKDCEIFF